MTIFIATTLWFVCGIGGMVMAVNASYEFGEEFPGKYIWWTLAGPIWLYVAIWVWFERKTQ